MVPSALVFLDTLPLTPNGKVDRKALPMPACDGFELEQVYIAPRNAAEQIIAGIWAEILGRKPIGIHDNFFDLGGHSLKATQVVSRLRKAFRREIPLRHLFEFPTIAKLANAILAQQAATLDGSEPAGILAEIEECSKAEAELEIAERNN
jgi:acyl carrier protein